MPSLPLETQNILEYILLIELSENNYKYVFNLRLIAYFDGK
jgi:hypothetical protein